MTETLRIFRKSSGFLVAAHPVIKMGAFGFSRAIFLTACPVCRSASAVTAQVLTMIAVLSTGDSIF